MNISFDKASLLLHVVEKARGYPRLQAIHDAAMAELEEMVKPDPVSASPPPEPAPPRTVGPQGATVTHPSVPVASSSDPFPTGAGGIIASRRSIADVTSGGSDAA